MFLQHVRSSLIVLSSLCSFFLLGSYNSGTSINDGRGDGSNDSVASIASMHRGVVDDMVGGVCGGLGVHADLGNVMNLGMNLVSDQTGLRDMVNIDGLVDTGSGDSNSCRDSMSYSNGSMGNSNRSSMGNSNRSSMGNSSNSRGSSIGSNWGSMGNSSNRGSMSHSSNSRGSSIGSNRGSMGNSSYRGSMSYSSNSRGSSIGQSMSGKDTVSGQTNSKIAGISISSGGSHGGTQQGRKDNKGVHVAES